MNIFLLSTLFITRPPFFTPKKSQPPYRGQRNGEKPDKSFSFFYLSKYQSFNFCTPLVYARVVLFYI